MIRDGESYSPSRKLSWPRELRIHRCIRRRVVSGEIPSHPKISITEKKRERNKRTRARNLRAAINSRRSFSRTRRSRVSRRFVSRELSSHFRPQATAPTSTRRTTHRRILTDRVSQGKTSSSSSFLSRLAGRRDSQAGAIAVRIS